MTFPSIHDVPDGAPIVARQRAAGPRALRRFSARCACGWSTGKCWTYDGAWSALLAHISDARLTEILAEPSEAPSYFDRGTLGSSEETTTNPKERQ